MKILMVTTSLGIGGAETHIVELSKALRRLGHEIHVVSDGGVYVDELSSAGIPCHSLPLNSYSPFSLAAAYHGLKKLIREQKPDVVHSHVRLPSFLLSRIARRDRSFRFVTTCHLDFKVNKLLKVLSDWGQRTLAVSPDIKQYLTASYGLNPAHIKCTVNGIDGEKFSPDIDFSPLLTEFSLSPDSKKVVYVSRLDADRSKVAFDLIACAAEINRRYNNVEILIVGDGGDFEKLKNEAEKVNGAVGKRVVILTGGRTDINRFAAMSDIFVAVSRSVLEAMSCGKPVIVAGNQGYLGILTEENFPAAAETNFCCRGCPDPSPALLKKDLFQLLDSPAVELRKQGEFNRSVIECFYSTRRMAEDALWMYRQAPSRMKNRGPKIVLCGYYGFGNSGDDLLLESISGGLRRNIPDAEIKVMSNAPRRTGKFFGIRCINRYHPLTVLYHILRADLFISGGGTLLSDSTSDRSLLYYTALISLAKRLGTKVMVYGSGIGPVTSDKSRKRVLKALRKCDAISVREESSLIEIREYESRIADGQPSVLGKVKITADPAFLAELPCDPAWDENVAARSGVIKGEKYFALALRPWKACKEDFEDEIVKFCKVIHERGYSPLIIPMQKNYDENLAGRLYERIRETDGNTALAVLHSPSDAAILFRFCDFAVGMRLHSLIYAALAGKPAICLSYEPKTDAISDQLGFPYVEAAKFSAENALPLTEELIRLICEPKKLKKRVNELRKSAESDPTYAKALING